MSIGNLYQNQKLPTTFGIITKIFKSREIIALTTTSTRKRGIHASGKKLTAPIKGSMGSLGDQLLKVADGIKSDESRSKHDKNKVVIPANFPLAYEALIVPVSIYGTLSKTKDVNRNNSMFARSALHKLYLIEGKDVKKNLNSLFLVLISCHKELLKKLQFDVI